MSFRLSALSSLGRMPPSDMEKGDGQSPDGVSVGNELAINVIVNYQTWLPLTETWIYNQVKHLPKEVAAHVVCGATRNLDQFPVSSLRCLERLSVVDQVNMLARGLLRCGLPLRRRNALIAEVSRQNNAKIVHSHFGYTAYHSAALVKRLGLRHFVTFYGVDMSALPRADRRWRARYKKMFGMVDQVLCEGPHMAKEVHRLGCPQEKLRVHHLGVDLDLLPFRPRQWRTSDPLRILVAASFREKKGIPLAIAAVARLAERFPVQLTIVGNAGSNPKSIAEKKKIHQAVQDNGVGSITRFLGYLPFPELLQEAYRNHVFLAPSLTASDGDSEGGAPVTLIEMAATGMPVVSTRHADIPEVIIDRAGGLLANEDDVAGLFENLFWLVSNPEKWEPMAEFARRHVELEFDAKRQGERLSERYQQALKN